MFFHFHQNNSGGFYVGPQNVVIEARSADEANVIAARTKFVYFDGVADGLDCECCGDRWYRQYSDDDGTETPSVFGISIDGGVYSSFFNGQSVYIRRADGGQSFTTITNMTDMEDSDD